MSASKKGYVICVVAVVSLVVFSQGASYAFRAAPKDEETIPEAHERTLNDFFEELQFYGLKTGAVQKVVMTLDSLTKENAGVLDDAVWPSRFAIIPLSEVPWYDGPRDSYLESDDMSIIYDDFLHKEYWLISIIDGSGREGDPVKEIIEKLYRRAKEEKILSELEDSDGETVAITPTDEAYYSYCLAEAAAFQAGYLKAVLDLGKDIMDLNNAPASLRTKKIPEIGDKIIYYDDDNTLERYVSPDKAEKGATFIFDKRTLIPKKALTLKKDEKEILLNNFLPLDFPRSTEDFLKRLNENAELKAYFKSVRAAYLKKHAEEMEKYAIDDSLFLDEEEFDEETKQ